MNKLLKFSSKVNSNMYILSIRNGFLNILPLIVINSFLGLVINLLVYFNLKESYFNFYTIFVNISITIQNIIPYLFIFLFSQNLFLTKYGKYNLQISFFSIIALLLYSIFLNDTSFIINDSVMLRAILIGLLNFKLYETIRLTIEKLFYNKQNRFFEKNNIFESIYLGFFNFVILSSIYYTVLRFFPDINLDLTRKLKFDNSLDTPLIYNTILLLPWIFGVNGSLLVQSSYVQLFINSKYNIKALAEHMGNLRYIDESFYNLYINIGGSGATLCLLIALFISKKKEYRRFTKLALIPALFNINEIIVFGMPIVGNIFLTIPFLLVPTIFTILTYIALKLHFLLPASTYTSWLTPTILSGLLSNKENYRPVIWQIFLITIGTLIYLFFLKKYESIKNEIYIKDMDSINDSSLNYDIGGVHFEYILEFNEAKKKLKSLLEKGYLTLYFQPIIDLSNNKVVKMESLVRIIHDDLGVVSPYFLKYFKSLNKMSELDYWVVEESFVYGKLLETEKYDVCLSINISVETFVQKNFLENMTDLVKKYEVNPVKYTIEIVEEVCLYDLNSSKNKINELRNMGFKIAIDDFGTGYSSLSYLLDLSVDYIKIDRKFVLSLEFEKGKTVLKNVIQLCKDVGCIIIVEGVEKEYELNILRELGADMVQGYYFYKPNNYKTIMEEIKKIEQ